MKIAFIVNSFPCVSQTFIFNQVTGLIDLGHRVEIYSTEIGSNHIDKFKNEIVKYNLLNNTFNIPKNKLYIKIKCLFTIMKKIIIQPATLIQLINVKKYKFNLLNFIYLYSNLVNKNFDILHCHFGPNGIRGAILKNLGIDGKLVTTFHGYDANMYPKKYGNNVYKELFTQCNIFTANTYYTKYQMYKLGCNKKLINILPVGLNIDKFKYQEKNINNQERIIFITVGRLVEKKGYDYSIRAFAKLYNENKNIIYYIVGDGEKKEELYELVDQLKIKNGIKFFGSLDSNNIIRLFNKSNIFVLASVTARGGDKEGQALVLQEAQAVGLPVLSTYHNGIPEGIINGKSGFLVKEKNINELYERMKFMAKNYKKLKDFGKIGRSLVESRYDIKKLNRELIKIYNNKLLM